MPRRNAVSSIRKIIQMYEVSNSFSLNELANMCSCSRTSVKTVINAIKIHNLKYDQIKNMSDNQLEKLIYPPRDANITKAPLDYEYFTNELKKPHVTKMMLWREYIAMNPDGYQRTQFFELLNKNLVSKKITMHMNRKPGEKMYVDWVGDSAMIYDRNTGEAIKVFFFISTIGVSSYPYVEAFLDRKKQSYIQGHVNAFRYYNGLPLAVVPDNDKSAVTKVGKYDSLINETYQRMADYYKIGVLNTRSRSPKDKGAVEKAVLDVAERELIGGLRKERFFSLQELNERILEKLKDVSERPFQKRPGSRKSVFLEVDYPAMRPLPEKPFTYVEFAYATVNVDYHIEVDSNFYSVPYKYIGKRVKIELYTNEIKVYFNNEFLAMHKRLLIKKYKYQTELAHMPKDHQLYHKFNKEYFIDWGKKISPEAEEIIKSMFEKRPIEEQSIRGCLGIQRLYKDYGANKFKDTCAIICDKNLDKTYRNIKKVIETIESIVPKETIINHNNIRGKDYYS
ncbi:MAG: IS21 family transposase [Bacilli bacterium]